MATFAQTFGGTYHYYAGEAVAVQLMGAKLVKGVLARNYRNANSSIHQVMVLEPGATMFVEERSSHMDKIYPIKAEVITGITRQALDSLR